MSIGAFSTIKAGKLLFFTYSDLLVCGKSFSALLYCRFPSLSVLYNIAFYMSVHHQSLKINNVWPSCFTMLQLCASYYIVGGVIMARVLSRICNVGAQHIRKKEKFEKCMIYDCLYHDKVYCGPQSEIPA